LALLLCGRFAVPELGRVKFAPLFSPSPDSLRKEGATMNRVIVTVVTAIVLTAALSAKAQNTVTFDNQSGEPALVKLIGQTPKEVLVPTGTKQSVEASAGRYTIKVRYGTPGMYRYSKGQEFDVKETATTKSAITITLHKVVAGNYASRPITGEEFAAETGQAPPPLPSAALDGKTASSTSTPGVERNPSSVEPDTHDYNARIAEAIKQVNAIEAAQAKKGAEVEFDMAEINLEMKMSGVAGELMGKLSSNPMATMNFAIQATRRFVRKDNIYPQLPKRNEDADEQAYLAAVQNVTDMTINKIVTLAGLGALPEPKLTATVLLLGCAGQYVTKKGTVNTVAFNAALDNLSAEKLAKVGGYFADTMETCSVLLRASGRFTNKDGTYDTGTFNARLGAITSERVEAVNKQLTKPNKATAFDILLRP
jgi:hypothetical protein